MQIKRGANSAGQRPVYSRAPPAESAQQARREKQEMEIDQEMGDGGYNSEDEYQHAPSENG